MREVVLALVGVSSGMGEAEVARPSPGARKVGSFDPDEVGVREEVERAESGVRFDNWVGLVMLSGLKLWPVSTAFGFVDEFQRGRWPIVDDGRWILLASVEASLEPRESMARRDAVVFFGSWLAGVGIDTCLRFAGWGKWLLRLPERCLATFAVGVVGSRPRLDMMTEEGGELPGVSSPLPMVERSLDSKLEMESLSCWPFLSDWMSSSMTSVSLI